MVKHITAVNDNIKYRNYMLPKSIDKILCQVDTIKVLAKTLRTTGSW